MAEDKVRTNGGEGSSSQGIAKRAKNAFNEASMSLPSGAEGDGIRRRVLGRLRRKLEESKEEIQRANEVDVSKAKAAQMASSLISRLELFAKKGKWESMLDGVDQVAALPSPLEECTFAKRLADKDGTGKGDLDLYRITCPIGVLLCIFEARPEVIVNIACLSIKSGNAAILKGGKESMQTAQVLSRVLRQTLEETKELPSDLVQTVETREDVAQLLTLDEYIDLVIPRGSNELVKSIQRQSSIPVMGHADGLCCGYIHSDAEVESTIANIIDSKTDYPAACNAIETILLHSSLLAKPLLQEMVAALHTANVKVHLDEASFSALDPKLSSSELSEKATANDFTTEWLSLDVAIKVVDSLDEAIRHINTHGSHHTDVIFTSSSDTSSPNPAAARFVRSVDSANVYINASTRFADGFRYGFGTEVGISTGKIHARGPVGLEGLVTYKYVLSGKGSGSHTVNDFSTGQRKWSHVDITRQYTDV
jgi:glutamate-5-semialdehyde dehydrogenase